MNQYLIALVDQKPCTSLILVAQEAKTSKITNGDLCLYDVSGLIACFRPGSWSYFYSLGPIGTTSLEF